MQGKIHSTDHILYAGLLKHLLHISAGKDALVFIFCLSDFILSFGLNIILYEDRKFVWQEKMKTMNTQLISVILSMMDYKRKCKEKVETL